MPFIGASSRVTWRPRKGVTVDNLRDPEAVDAVLGSIISRGAEVLGDVIEVGLEPQHLPDERDRLIYRAMIALVTAGKSIDLVTVRRQLKETGGIDTVGDAYLAELGAGIPVSIDVVPHAQELVRLAERRALLTSAHNLQEAAKAGNGDLPAAISDLQQTLTSYNDGGGIAVRVKNYLDCLEGVFDISQLYVDLSLQSAAEKTAARQVIWRLKGKRVQPHGNKAGRWRVIDDNLEEINFGGVTTKDLPIWLPFDLHDYARIMPGNIIVIAGDPDAGKTTAVLNVIKHNVEKWDVHYFNSEMGAEELLGRLKLFDGFPIGHPHFHAYERSCDFQDVLRTEKYCLNIIDFLEVTEDFWMVGKMISDIHRALGDAVAVICLQKKDLASDLPLGGLRSLEKPRLAIAMKRGIPNMAKVLKLKNRKCKHSMLNYCRDYNVVNGSELHCRGKWESRS